MEGDCTFSNNHDLSKFYFKKYLFPYSSPSSQNPNPNPSLSLLLSHEKILSYTPMYGATHFRKDTL